MRSRSMVAIDPGRAGRSGALLIVAIALLAGCAPTSAPPSTASQGATAAPSISPMPSTSPSALSSAAPTSVLEGIWATPVTTCDQQNRALASAGFAPQDLESAGWDTATCGEDIHGRQFTIEFAGDRLVVYQDGVVGWEGAFRVAGPDTFEAGDMGGDPEITYEYAIDGDQLTIDMVRDNLSGLTPADLINERLAQTVIYETSPFVRATSSSALPYDIRLPDGWAPSGEAADTFQSPDGRMTLTVGTGQPDPGQTVEDRVRINRTEEFAECQTDPSLDRPVTLGGERAIMWTFDCGDAVGVAVNTIHDGVGYRLTLRAATAAPELDALMTEILAGFRFQDQGP